ncbi:putative amidoligase domain-containing protein [Guptibacillus hwajinpoensis]|uniref:ATP-grasp domain-containing protein n=1 Tax=Guptibacillus hwajinpoensis TaxID=208199 RepID=A0A0J6FRE1_9BACL|nr:YheC/YheD family protein [Alkalihalobacillus macyae]KMM36902.1 hypothetical protein AB986_13380 [Alkalihalobacillus macyae]
MNLLREQFSISSDKELMLQTLALNNIRSLELVNPQTCTYPIVGRKYGHYQGKDISIIHTQSEAIEKGYDFFTKLCIVEKEYLFHIQGLKAEKVFITEEDKVIYTELPIRTQAYGWTSRQVELHNIPEEWIKTAIRALYVVGLPQGVVKIGVLPNESHIVLDINESNRFKQAPVTKAVSPFTIGADIEFMLSCDNELLPASTFFPIQGSVGCDERQIEQDSGQYALAELRPVEAETPHEVFQNMKTLVQKASALVPYENVAFRAGSMPFVGYQCGGHLHFGIPCSASLLKALDQYLAIPIAMIENSRTAKRRRRTNHGGLGRYRVKPYGMEYLSLSSWVIEPTLSLSILCLAKLVGNHHHEFQDDFVFYPVIQRAYYNGNYPVLKQLWPHIKKNIQTTSTYAQYKSELTLLFEAIERGCPIEEECDFRVNWGVEKTTERYEQDASIQIPKKLRMKHNLNEGDTTHVRAGIKLVPATIKPYPFAFQNSDKVHLSKVLRDQLSLPEGWSPTVFSSNDVLTLGPIVGILANRPFDRQTTYFQHLFNLAQEKQMLVYAFEPDDIDWDQMTIKGTSIDGEGIFPFPAVIYDRYLLIRDKSQVIKDVRFKFQYTYKIPFINSPSLFKLTGDKWKTHQLLSNDYGNHLPETKSLKQPEDLVNMLNKHGEVFVKPVGGALSMGINRILRKPTNIIMTDVQQNTSHDFANIDELLIYMAPHIKHTDYVIQEGIRRKQYNGYNVEIRVYMQKGIKNRWLRTGMVARLSNEDVLTEESEINLRVSKVLLHLYPDSTERKLISKQIGKLAGGIVETVQDEVGTFGEIAVDLCIDQYDSIKLLEINAKPDNLFSQIRAYKLRTLAGHRLLNYASILAGYEGL